MSTTAFFVSHGFFAVSAEIEDGGRALAAAAWAFRPPGVEAHAHLQMDGDAGFAVLQLFHANDLGDVLAVHRVVGRRVGEGDENAHAGIVGFEAASEINAAF